MVINLEKRSVRLFINGKRRRFQGVKKLFNCDFFNGFGLFSFLFWLSDFLVFYRMYMVLFGKLNAAFSVRLKQVFCGV